MNELLKLLGSGNRNVIQAMYYTVIPYRASTGSEQGFPCEVFPHKEKPFFTTGNPFSYYRDFSVRKTS